jgi:hypothetical protein
VQGIIDWWVHYTCGGEIRFNYSTPMKRRTKYLLTVCLLCSLGGAAVWYYTPVRVENLNRMPLCMCGPLKVEFKSGRITVMDSPHPTDVKPGTVIGSYTRVGDSVKIIRETKEWTGKLDHVGMRQHLPDGFDPYDGYEAFDGESLKTKIHFLLSGAAKRARNLFR